MRENLWLSLILGEQTLKNEKISLYSEILIKTIKSLSYFKGGVMRGKDSFPPHIVSQKHANAIFAILQKKIATSTSLFHTS